MNLIQNLICRGDLGAFDAGDDSGVSAGWDDVQRHGSQRHGQADNPVLGPVHASLGGDPDYHVRGAGLSGSYAAGGPGAVRLPPDPAAGL